MSPHLIVFIAGTALICACALGGGVKIKELEVPRIEPLSRVLSGIIGICLIAFGMYIEKHDGTPENLSAIEREKNICSENIDAAVRLATTKLSIDFEKQKKEAEQDLTSEFASEKAQIEEKHRAEINSAVEDAKIKLSAEFDKQRKAAEDELRAEFASEKLQLEQSHKSQREGALIQKTPSDPNKCYFRDRYGRRYIDDCP